MLVRFPTKLGYVLVQVLDNTDYWEHALEKLSCSITIFSLCLSRCSHSTFIHHELFGLTLCLEPSPAAIIFTLFLLNEFSVFLWSSCTLGGNRVFLNRNVYRADNREGIWNSSRLHRGGTLDHWETHETNWDNCTQRLSPLCWPR